VMFLTLGIMPYRAVIVWRDVKHSTSAGRGGGKNTHGVELWNYLKFLVYLDARMIFKKVEGIPMVEEVMV